MKKIIASLIVILTLIVIGSYFYQANKVVPPPVVATTTPEIIVKKEDVILLYPESGDVTFKATPNEEFQKATTSPTIIPNQSIVKTGVGNASVLLPDNSTITLDENTEITVNYGEQNTSIYQTLGTTYHRVQALLSGKSYQVQTQGTLAAVRGTKFAVSYDVKAKKTKIAVTENKVEVSTVPKAIGTTTVPTPEVMMVEVGKMVSVLDDVKPVAGKPVSAMTVTEIEKDVDMRTFIEEEKQEDVKVEAIKSVAPDEDAFRREMKKVMFEDEGLTPKLLEASSTTEETLVAPTTRTQTSTTTPKTVTAPKTTTPTTNTTVKTTTATTETIVKMGEEEFFNAFEPLFIKYFYVDDAPDSACDQKVIPSQRVDIVTSFARKNGYPFTKSLLSFAQAIDAYCANKTADTKIRLQARFDEDYPFAE